MVSWFSVCATYDVVAVSSIVYETIRSKIIYYSCRKFTFENCVDRHKNVMLEVRFFIRIPFVCSELMH